MANPIAGDSDVVVALILSPLEPSVSGILPQLGSVSPQQRSKPVISTAPHPCQSSAAGTAQQAQQDGFNLIILMMSQHDPSMACTVGSRLEELTSAGPGCHLDRFVTSGSAGPDIHLTDRAWQTMQAGHLSDNGGILQRG